MYLLLAFAYRWVEWDIPPLIPFYTTNNILVSVKRSNFTLFLFKAACHANPGAEGNYGGSSSYILRHIYQKFSDTSANNNVRLWTYISLYSPKFFISQSLQTFFTCA